MNKQILSIQMLKIVPKLSPGYPRVSGSRSPNDSNSNQQEWINISTKANPPAYPWKGILHGKWYETRELKEIK